MARVLAGVGPGRAPAAIGRGGGPAAWGAADLRFDRSRGWSGRGDASAPWQIAVEGLTLELRATDSGGVGLFPEHLANAGWLGSAIRARAGGGNPPAVLNLFAHTGLTTLLPARAAPA